MAPIALIQGVQDLLARYDWRPAEIESVSRVITAGAVAFLLHRFLRRVPWPRPFRLRFALLNAAAALATGLLWLGLSAALQGPLLGTRALDHASRWWTEYLVLGAILFAVVAGITYSAEAAARAARAEALATSTRLAALRAQIHPHFVFNALHAVVHLIPTDPARAAEAAELVASLLRTTVEEDRDEVTLEDEWSFVSRYLEVEQIRFGDRLRVHSKLDPDLLDERVPSFAVQTLVENAVRHGAAHRVAPTEIVVTAEARGPELRLSIWNSGDGPGADPVEDTRGTGLARLRERLTFLYGDRARLTCGTGQDGGFEAVLVIPRTRRRA